MQSLITILKKGSSPKAIYELSVIVVLSMLSVASLVFMNYLYGKFYEGLTGYNWQLTLACLTCYTLVMLFVGMCDAEMHYRKRIFTINFRDTIYHKYGKQVLTDEKASFSCQRMSQDVMQFPSQFVDLFCIFLHSILIIPSFLYVLLNGPIGMLTIALSSTFTVFVSIILKNMRKPVAKMQYNQESLEAALRRDLISEIDKKDINAKNLPAIDKILDNYKKMSARERILVYLKHMYDRFKYSIPYIILVPKYFQKEITIGQMIQNGAALAKLLTEISFFINNVEKIAEFDATIKRLKELDQ